MIKSITFVSNGVSKTYHRYSSVEIVNDGLLEITLTQSTARILNTGRPYDGRVAGKGFDFYSISSFVVECSSPCVSVLGSVDGSVVSSDDGYKITFNSVGNRHPANGLHGLDGGDRFFCAVTPSFQYSMPVAVNDRFNALTLFGAGLQNLSRVIELYDFVDHGFGVRMLPDVLTSRYATIPYDAVSGWYGCYDIQSAGEGFTNCHYGHDAWFMLNGLLNGSDASHFIGHWLLVSKLCYGYLQPGKNWYDGMYRYEKGSGPTGIPTRRGVSQAPATAKEWDIGLLVGHMLYKTSPFADLINQVVNERRANLLNRPPQHVWNGSGGARNLGNYLSNLLDFYDHDLALGLGNQDAYFAKFNKVLTHVMKIVGTDPYFKNIQDGTISLWEEMGAVSLILKWIRRIRNTGSLQDYSAQLKKIVSMVSFYHSKAISTPVINGVEYLHCNYIWNSKTGKIEGKPHPLHCVWWLGVYAELALNEGHYDRSTLNFDPFTLGHKCLMTVTSRLGQNWAEITAGHAPLAKLHVDNVPYGLSAEKQWPIALTGIRYARY